MEKILVKEVSLECIACPTCWEGVTYDRRKIAARYRFGRLSIRMGKVGDGSENAADLWREVWAVQLGGRDDGCLSYGELKAATAGVVEWPEYEAE